MKTALEIFDNDGEYEPAVFFYRKRFYLFRLITSPPPFTTEDEVPPETRPTKFRWEPFPRLDGFPNLVCGGASFYQTALSMRMKADIHTGYDAKHS